VVVGMVASIVWVVPAIKSGLDDLRSVSEDIKGLYNSFDDELIKVNSNRNNSILGLLKFQQKYKELKEKYSIFLAGDINETVMSEANISSMIKIASKLDEKTIKSFIRGMVNTEEEVELYYAYLKKYIDKGS